MSLAYIIDVMIGWMLLMDAALIVGLVIWLNIWQATRWNLKHWRI